MSIAIKIPAVGESVSEVTIAAWLKKEGDFVQKDEVICEIDSDKATFEIAAEASGTLHILKAEGETVPVGEVIAEVVPGETVPAEAPAAPVAEETESAEKQAEESESATTLEATQEVKQKPVHRKASPVAEKILQEAGIPIDRVAGSGPGGKILKEDALRAVEESKARVATTAAPPPEDKRAAPLLQTPGTNQRHTRREKMTTLRKTIARHLVEAKNQTAMLTTFNEVDMSEIMTLRRQYKEVFQKKYNVGLGFMSFFTRAVCIALSEFPPVNAMIEGDEIVFHDYCDIGIAVATDRGLVVPIIRNAERLSLWQIEAQIEQLAEKARTNRLSLEEMTGGTFTITNGGVFGSLMSTPIINYPQAAILGMHKISERPVVVSGQIQVRPMMYVALSYDHRLIDGRDSVQFLVRVKELLEEPARMLLEV